MKSVTIALLLAVVVLSGCTSFWQDQGEAARTRSEASRLSAVAKQQNAQAAIIDAQARGALADSQAKALDTTVRANVDLANRAISLADRGEYVWLMAIVLLAVLAAVVFVVYAFTQRPVVIDNRPIEWPAIAAQRGIWIETPYGRVLVEPQPGETRYHYVVRVREMRDMVNADSWTGLLPAGDQDA